MKIQRGTRNVTQTAWDKYLSVKDLADNLYRIADSIANLPSDARGKVKLKIEIARQTQPRTATKSRRR